MLQYKYRKQLVLNRKLPRYKFIGILSDKFLSLARSDCEKRRSSIELTKKNNHFIDNYDVLENYDQRHTDIELPSVFDVFGKIHDLRYGILESKKKIPSHIDAPDGHRFIAVIQGSHVYNTDDLSIEMNEGQVWFINSSYEHSVDNLSHKDRIALLGKFNDTTKLLRTVT